MTAGVRNEVRLGLQRARGLDASGGSPVGRGQAAVSGR